MSEQRNGRSTWIAVASIGVSVIIFISGWFAGQRVAWTESGQQLEKIQALEKWQERRIMMEVDQENRLNAIGTTAASTSSEVTKLREDLRDLRGLCLQSYRNR